MSVARTLKNFQCREGGASEAEISSLEAALSITLPNDFRYFLRAYGYGMWFGGGPLGIPHEDFRFKKYKDAKIITSYFRELFHAKNYQKVPKHGLVVNKYDGGGYYFLFSKESERAGEVGLFLTEVFGQQVAKFICFTDYLSFLITGSPEPELVSVDYEKVNDILGN